MIAKPFSPGNAFPAEEVARERLTFDKAMIGSCTNGSYDDLLSAALVLRRRARAGPDEGGEGVRRVPRLGRREAADRAARPAAGRRVDRRRVPRGRAGRSAQSGAARASARARTRSPAGQRAITSFNRNWQNRMGFGGEGYLASPVGRRGLGARGLHGAAERARAGVGS